MEQDLIMSYSPKSMITTTKRNKKTTNKCKLHRGLWTHSQHKFVWFWIDDLLGDVKVGERLDRAEEGDVALPQLEDGPGPDGAGKKAVADEGPGLEAGLLTIILKQADAC